MLDKKMFLRICLLVFTGISCSFISRALTTTAPTQDTQPGLYPLEDALTMAVETLQADPRIAIASKTSKPDDPTDTPNPILKEQPESEDNTGETNPSVENPVETESPTGRGNCNTDEGLNCQRVVDPEKINDFHPTVSGSCPGAYSCTIDYDTSCQDPYNCKENDPVLDSRVHVLYLGRDDLTIPIPPPAITVKRDESGESEGSSEGSSEGAPEGSHGIEIPPISIDPPGLPPLPPIQPPTLP
jgi:hypothetical protein